MRFRSILAFLCIILVSGCVGQGGNDEDLSQGQFLGGEKGLDLQFVDTPPKVFEGDPFNILLEVTNFGEEGVDIGEAEFTLSNSNAFGITDNYKTSDEGALVKATKVRTFGGQTFIEFNDARYVGGVLSSESVIPISVDACYPYSTTSTVELCIARSEFSETCSPVERKDVENSGAPIQITEAEQILSIMTNNKIRIAFVLTIENKGEETDTIYSTKLENAVEGTGTTCSERKTESANEVTISELRIGSANSYSPTEIKNACGSSSIRFNEDGVGTLKCNFQIDEYVPGAGDYVELMTIRLAYLHNTIVNTEISIIPK